MGRLRGEGSLQASRRAFMIRVVASLGGHQKLGHLRALPGRGHPSRYRALRLQSGGPQGRREGPPGDERGNWETWMGEVAGAPREFNPRWKRMLRRALEDLQLLGVLRFFGTGIWGFKKLRRSDFPERALYLKKDAQKQFKRSSWLGSQL